MATDTESELVFGGFATERLDNLRKSLSLGETGDTFGEVGVSLAVACDRLPQPRDDSFRVKVVKGANEFVVGSGELKNDHAAARSENTQHLAHALLQMYEVANPESTGDGVKCTIGEW